MPTYFEPVRYEKKIEKENFFKNRNFYFWGNSTVFPVTPFIIAFVLVLTQVVLPVYFFKSNTQIPVVAEKSVLGYSTGYREFSFNELKTSTNVRSDSTEDIPKYFYISIPKLGISSALVETDSTNLSPDNSIGHYKGSSHPGKPGTSYLYGHSVLPVFYNARNYKTIFSTLDDLETGDEIIVNFADKNYLYRVEGFEELKVSEVNPLQNKKPNDPKESTLVLMTCWPAGTKAKRFEVTATLQDL
jgi:LPXTG-site transpeptidase (sortase) family protein